jgi:hypothetical protein
MKKKLVLAALLAVAAPALWLGSGGSPNWADQNQALGQKLAGGWLATLEIPSIPLTAEVLLNLTADGCMIINGQLLKDFPEPGAIGMNTTAHGTWKRTGPDKIEACILLFEADDSGNTVLYEKARCYLTLKERGTILEGLMDINLIWVKGVTPKPDPLDPETEWWPTIPANISARPIWFPADL